jgi:hypothetical protein
VGLLKRLWTMFTYPYQLEETPPHFWQVDGHRVLLSKGWRLKREVRMAESTEGIGSRKWSLLRTDDNVVVVHQGKTPLAALTPDGLKVKELIVTSPQLWEAANDMIQALKLFDTVNSAEMVVRVHAARSALMKAVAKAAGKDDWYKVLQG